MSFVKIGLLIKTKWFEGNLQINWEVTIKIMQALTCVIFGVTFMNLNVSRAKDSTGIIFQNCLNTVSTTKFVLYNCSLLSLVYIQSFILRVTEPACPLKQT